MKADKLLQQGILHHNAGDLATALSHYQSLLEKEPKHAQALRLVGLVQIQLGAFREAISPLKKALTFDNNHVECLSNLGLAYAQCQEYQNALSPLSKAYKLAPSHQGVLNNLGVLYKLLGKTEKAIELFEGLLRVLPDSSATLSNLAYLYDKQGKVDKAFKTAKAALEFNPHDKATWFTLAAICTHQKNFVQAQILYEQVFNQIEPTPDERLQFALMLAEAGKLTQAIEQCKQILEQNPQHTETQWNLGLALLKTKDFERGWLFYASYWNKHFINGPLTYDLPWWIESTPKNARCLIRAEQGVGDEVMFSNIVPKLLETMPNVTLECDVRLQTLFERSFPGIQTRDKHSSLCESNAFDVQTKMADIFACFRKTASDFPQHKGYLSADVDAVRHLQATYRSQFPNQLLVGFSWLSGNKHNGAQRSIPLDMWEQLFCLEGVHWFNCQYGEHSKKISNISQKHGIDISQPPCEQLVDLDTYASFLSALDLVISVDNSTVHIASAVGTEVWVLLNHNSDWRWGIEELQSYWYPQTQIIRQDKPGEWQLSLDNARCQLLEVLKKWHSEGNRPFSA